MKKILIFMSVLTALAFTNAFIENTSITIAPTSKLFIIGKTNVSNFKCEYNILKLNKPIPVFFKNRGDKIIFEKTVLILDNINFDCGGSGMNNDFQALLKTKTNPKIFILLKEINKDNNDERFLHALVDLEIAGITKSYTIPVELNDGVMMSIKGVLDLNIRDFNLEPPKKALGLVVVKDIIEINFQLNLKRNK